jgi:hypothetical protein
VGSAQHSTALLEIANYRDKGCILPLKSPANAAQDSFKCWVQQPTSYKSSEIPITMYSMELGQVIKLE